MPLILRPTVAELHDSIEIPDGKGQVGISLVHGEWGWEANLSLSALGGGTQEEALKALVDVVRAFLVQAEGGITVGGPRERQPPDVS